MIIKLGLSNLWKKISQTDVFGTLFSTFNIDLRSNVGHLRVSPRLLLTTDNITDLDVAVGFQIFTDQNAGVQYIWAVAGKFIWRSLLTDGYIAAFGKDISTGTPDGSNAANSMNSDYSDLVFYGKTYMVASGNTSLYCYTASSGQWTNPASSPNLSGGSPHPMCVFGARFYVVDVGTQVRSMTTAFGVPTSSGSNFLDLTNKGYPVTIITTLKQTSSEIWIGTINQSESGCYVFSWDGTTATDPNAAYFIPDASGILAIIIKNDSPWLIDNNGRLLYRSSQSFVEAPNGRLPAKYPKFLKNSLSGKNDRWIHPNGICLVDGRIRILINNEYADSGATIEENIASGIWEYAEDTGWIHIASLSMYLASGGSLADYGQNRIVRVGALFSAKDDSVTASRNGTMLLGAQYYSDASATKYGIFTDDSNDSVQKFGYIITPKIYSSQIRETWQKLYVRLRKLLVETDRIIVKYRTSEVSPVEATITWTSTTTATSSTDLSAYEGYEIEVLQGKGAGKCSKITSAVFAAGSTSLVFEETFTGASSGTAKARFQFWKEISQPFTDQVNDVAEFAFAEMSMSSWIQLKLCMQFTGKDEVDELIIASKENQKIQA